MKKLIGMLLGLSTVACVAIPVTDYSYEAKCEISSDRKTLKIIDVAKETNTYYSIEGLTSTPILLPISAVVSGTYVAINNVYQIGEERVKCGSGENQKNRN
ncbi:MAG: hypothetical protein OEW58_04695 [Gammaproteobacteria bacterium]|nr:hypothetical protein [Gammaproteobacteria bacterium]